MLFFYLHKNVQGSGKSVLRNEALVCLCLGFTAQSTAKQLRSYRAGQLPINTVPVQAYTY